MAFVHKPTIGAEVVACVKLLVESSLRLPWIYYYYTYLSSEDIGLRQLHEKWDNYFGVVRNMHYD